MILETLETACPETCLPLQAQRRASIQIPRKKMILCQGDTGDTVFYIRNGKVALSVVSDAGKQATLSVLGPGSFFGEECLAPIPQAHKSSAVAVTDCEVLRFEPKELLKMIYEEDNFSDCMVAYLITRNKEMQKDLVDKLFHPSEKRLARVLLQLGGFGKKSQQEAVITDFSQEQLAEMVGTTRSRVSMFMNGFRKLGFIDYGYDCSIRIHKSLEKVLLQESLLAA